MWECASVEYLYNIFIAWATILIELKNENHLFKLKFPLKNFHNLIILLSPRFRLYLFIKDRSGLTSFFCSGKKRLFCNCIFKSRIRWEQNPQVGFSISESNLKRRLVNVEKKQCRKSFSGFLVKKIKIHRGYLTARLWKNYLFWYSPHFMRFSVCIPSQYVV